jgi:tetratricopeptide (TPR) repeat protein
MASFDVDYNRGRSGLGHVMICVQPDLSAGAAASRRFLRRFGALFTILLIAACSAVDASASFETKRQLEFGVKMALEGSWREAAFRFQKVVRSDPDNAYAHNNLGVALESVGKFEEALKSYERALELDPGNGKIKENRDRLKAYMASRTAQIGAQAVGEDSGATDKAKPKPGESPPPATEGGHDGP